MVELWSEKSGMGVGLLLKWLGVRTSKYYAWKRRHGQKNRHNAPTPRTFWLEAWERASILAFYAQHPDEGYRRLAYMMLDADTVAVSPSSVYRVLKKAGVLKRWAKTSSRKGKGFHQPQKPHQHWHIDIAYINICGTFYYPACASHADRLCSVLDGYSRYVVHWEIRESMTAAEVEVILERARERFPEARPRIISDNGPQFVAKSFKEYIRICGMTHVRTAPFYPQSNGKIERWHKSLKTECIRPQTPLSWADAKRIVAKFVKCYNTERLHSAIGYVTPQDKLEGREVAIFADRKRKLAEARQRRTKRRQQADPKTAAARNHAPLNVSVAYAG